MIALHCTVALPRDYDIDRVRRRIADDASIDDDTAGLMFFAHGLREAGRDGVTRHQYALVSVWTNTSRMGAYLWAEGGFERIRAQYGGAQVSLWPVAGLQLDRATLAKADTLEVTQSAPTPDTALSRLGESAKDSAAKAIKSRDIHLAVRGLDVASGGMWSADVRSGLPRSTDGEVFALERLIAPARPA